MRQFKTAELAALKDGKYCNKISFKKLFHCCCLHELKSNLHKHNLQF
jgi:hypothetical protein